MTISVWCKRGDHHACRSDLYPCSCGCARNAHPSSSGPFPPVRSCARWFDGERYIAEFTDEDGVVFGMYFDTPQAMNQVAAEVLNISEAQLLEDDMRLVS